MIDPRALSALSFLAHEIRPTWDRAGIEAKLRDVAHLPLPDVALALVRAADDPSIATPGAFARTTSSCWRERNHDRPKPHEPFDPARSCGICGRSESACRSNPHGGHDFASVHTVRSQQRARTEETA